MTMALIFRVLGISGSFIMNNWRKLLTLIVIAALVYVVMGKIKAMEVSAYNKGVEATIQKVKQGVHQNDVVNRDTEKKNQASVDQYGAAKTAAAKKRHEAEQKSDDHLRTVVQAVPMWKSQECSITPNVMADRNAIRAQGPKEGVK